MKNANDLKICIRVISIVSTSKHTFDMKFVQPQAALSIVCSCSRRVVVFGRVKFSSSRLFITSLSETFKSSWCFFRSAMNYDR